MSKKITETKPATCIGCGTSIQINKVASPKTARCDECKGGKKERQAPPQRIEGETTVYGEDMSKPRIDGMPNKALHFLSCPFHPNEPMDIIGVIKSDDWGDVTSMQCRIKGCWTVVQISEQARRSGPWTTTADGTELRPEDGLEMIANGTMDEWLKGRYRA